MNAVERCSCEEPQIVQPLRWLAGDPGCVLFICNCCHGCYLNQSLDDIAPELRRVIWDSMGVDFTEPQ